jgi:hypothetical protein
VRLKAWWGERGTGRFIHALLFFTWKMIGKSFITSSKANSGIGYERSLGEATWSMGEPGELID